MHQQPHQPHTSLNRPFHATNQNRGRMVPFVWGGLLAMLLLPLVIGCEKQQYINGVPVSESQPKQKKIKPVPPEAIDLFAHDCAFTVEIATFYNDPANNYYNRMLDAELSAKSIYRTGEQAYVVHGRGESRVYVGCLPEAAVRRVQRNGTTTIELNPAVDAWQSRYTFYHENYQRMYETTYNEQGTPVKRPLRPKLVDVRRLKRAITF